MAQTKNEGKYYFITGGIFFPPPPLLQEPKKSKKQPDTSSKVIKTRTAPVVLCSARIEYSKLQLSVDSSPNILSKEDAQAGRGQAFICS
jgi:hypothetical protein